MQGVNESPLNRIHPYPGMIADEVAVNIAKKYIRRGSRVLDPFVGTGRTLAAASMFGGIGVGVDVNPLAVIVTRAKSSRPPLGQLSKLVLLLEERAKDSHGQNGLFVSRRQVRWFSDSVSCELRYLIDTINTLKLSKKSWVIVGAVLSATVREVSYCRKDQWKLHRLSEGARSLHCKSAVFVFLGRLRRIISELSAAQVVPTQPFQGILGDSRYLSKVLPSSSRSQGFDCIFTSPPYGDSRTTVQYGAISELCLEVISELKGLSAICKNFPGIDRRCLGGAPLREAPQDYIVPRSIWQGDRESKCGRKIAQFLNDLELVCISSIKYLRENGQVIFIVSRRSVSGKLLFLDKWLIKVLSKLGLKLVSVEKRLIKYKMTPSIVRPQARKIGPEVARGGGLTKTMKDEYIIVMTKN